jgi:hypothetical protein
MCGAMYLYLTCVLWSSITQKNSPVWKISLQPRDKAATYTTTSAIRLCAADAIELLGAHFAGLEIATSSLISFR